MFDETDNRIEDESTKRKHAVATFVSPELIDENDLPSVFRSTLVPEPLKRHIISAITDFTPNQEKAALTAAAEYSIRSEIRPNAISLRHMAQASIAVRILIQLLAAADSSVTDADVISILAAMAAPYPKLASNTPNKFDLPNDDSHQAVLSRLKRFGITLSSRRKASNPTLRSVTIGTQA